MRKFSLLLFVMKVFMEKWILKIQIWPIVCNLSRLTCYFVLINWWEQIFSRLFLLISKQKIICLCFRFKMAGILFPLVSASESRAKTNVYVSEQLIFSNYVIYKTFSYCTLFVLRILEQKLRYQFLSGWILSRLAFKKIRHFQLLKYKIKKNIEIEPC